MSVVGTGVVNVLALIYQVKDVLVNRFGKRTIGRQKKGKKTQSHSNYIYLIWRILFAPKVTYNRDRKQLVALRSSSGSLAVLEFEPNLSNPMP